MMVRLGLTPTAVELALEAAARRYQDGPTSETWKGLYAACAAALGLYGRLPRLSGRGTLRAQVAAVLADLEWRGIAVYPDHAAIERGGSMNQNPVEARLAKRKKGRAHRAKGSLGQLQGLLWAALERAGELLDDPDPARALKAVHAISTGAGAYARVVEVGELQGRLDALEARLAAQGAA